MTTTPDPHTMRLAWRLANQIAPRVTAAEAVLNDRLNRLDHGGQTGERVAGGGTSDPTQRQAMTRLAIGSDLAQIRDDINQLDVLIGDIYRTLGHAIARRPLTIDEEPPDVPVCFEGQHGKEGVIDWGDPLCAMPAVKRDLCAAHYQAWYRHRRGRGIDVANDHAPAVEHYEGRSA